MTPEYLNECFTWDYEGNLTWKERPRSHFKRAGDCSRFNKIYAGRPAGNTQNTGYHTVQVGSKYIRAHRILYMLYHNRLIPSKLQVDHIDENKLNNTFKNLRLATHIQNGWNRSITKANTSGYKGVSFNNSVNKFKAYISDGKKQLHLGYFTTAEEAHEAYKVASVKYHGEFSNLG